MFKIHKLTKNLRFSAVFFRPSFIVLLFSLLYTLSKLSIQGFDPTAFLYIGRTFLERDLESPITKFIIGTMGFPPHEVGYDGQMYYYIALDPFNAWRNLDTCARYQRILYPLTVKFVALGSPFFIPHAMIAVNIVSLVIGTEAIARMLKSKGLSPWFSLVYGLYIGQIFVIARDCIETFSYMFVLVAIYALENKKNPVVSAVLFALALFAKETAILFVVGYTLGLIFKTNLSLKKKLEFFVIAVVPYTLFQACLYTQFGYIPILTVGRPTENVWFPFYGALSANHGAPELFNMAFMIFIPSVLSCLFFIVDIFKKNLNGAVFSLILNALFLMFLPTPSYWNIQDYSRISIGLVAALLTYAIYNGKKGTLAYCLTWILPFSTYFTYA